MTSQVSRSHVLQKQIRLVVALTISWNIVEAVVALLSGVHASSAALIGFGLDSVVEVLSALAVAWQFSARDPHTREKIALRLISFSFFALSLYVGVEALLSLAGYMHAERTFLGIIVAMLSLIVMPLLSYWERRIGREYGSASAVADSYQTMMCTYLSAALLIGLIVNWLFGWSWADSLAALIIAFFAFREGMKAFHGDACCASGAHNLTSTCEEEDSSCQDDCCSHHLQTADIDATSLTHAQHHTDMCDAEDAHHHGCCTSAQCCRQECESDKCRQLLCDTTSVCTGMCCVLTQ